MVGVDVEEEVQVVPARDGDLELQRYVGQPLGQLVHVLWLVEVVVLAGVEVDGGGYAVEWVFRRDGAVVTAKVFFRTVVELLEAFGVVDLDVVEQLEDGCSGGGGFEDVWEEGSVDGVVVADEVPDVGEDQVRREVAGSGSESDCVHVGFGVSPSEEVVDLHELRSSHEFVYSVDEVDRWCGCMIEECHWS